MPIIMPYLTSENYNQAPYQQVFDFRYDNHEKYSQVVEKVISSYIDEATLLKIKQSTTLSIYDLLTPMENNRTSKVPRPQNSFVIYRRNLQAKMASQSTNSTFDKLDKVSKIAGKKWKNETKEIKELYAFIADCAKKVHGKIFPGYVYNPRKYTLTRIPMSDESFENAFPSECEPEPYHVPYYCTRVNRIKRPSKFNKKNQQYYLPNQNSHENSPHQNSHQHQQNLHHQNSHHQNSHHQNLHQNQNQNQNLPPNLPPNLYLQGNLLVPPCYLVPNLPLNYFPNNYLPSPVEINPNFMLSYDNSICRVLNKNTKNFL